MWRELTELPIGCLATVDEDASRTIALASRFTHLGSIDDIAARFGAVTATHFVQRPEDSTWAYFGVSVIRESTFEAREKSLINRQAAFYRFLIGAAPSDEPPLAP